MTGNGVWALLGTLLVAVVLAVLVRRRDGRIRAGRTPAGGGAPGLAALPAEVRELLTAEPAPVTLLQLSTTFCAPCRHTRVLLAALAARTDGLRHVELDLTDSPGLAADLAVLSTPTTLALDAGGVELLRISGVPKAESLLAALRDHLPAGTGERADESRTDH